MSISVFTDVRQRDTVFLVWRRDHGFVAKSLRRSELYRGGAKYSEQVIGAMRDYTSRRHCQARQWWLS